MRNNKQIIKTMKVKSFKEKKDWREDLPNTLISFAFLVFTVLAGFGVIDGDQAAQAGPIVSSTIGAISTAVAGVIALIGVLKKKEPVA